MNKLAMNQQLYGHSFDFFPKNLRTVVIHQDWVFDFLRTMVMKPKNHPGNHQGLFMFLVTAQHLVVTYLPRDAGGNQKDLQDRLPQWNLGNSIFIHPQLSHNGFLVDGAPESTGSHDPKLHKKLCWRRVGGRFVVLSKILSKFFTVFSKYFSRHFKAESSSQTPSQLTIYKVSRSCEGEGLDVGLSLLKSITTSPEVVLCMLLWIIKLNV